MRNLARAIPSRVNQNRTPGGGGGGVLCNFHTYVGSGHFWGFKILNNNIFWGGYFWILDFVDIFGGLSFRLISMHLRIFSQGQVTEWGYF